MNAKQPDFTNPKVSVVTFDHACEILGVATSTARKAEKKTGCLIDGVPVLKIGTKWLVSAILLREKLGIK